VCAKEAKNACCPLLLTEFGEPGKQPPFSGNKKPGREALERVVTR
jgi:hypothetical protein